MKNSFRVVDIYEKGGDLPLPGVFEMSFIPLRFNAARTINSKDAIVHSLFNNNIRQAAFLMFYDTKIINYSYLTNCQSNI
jgi:hypothetical protein